MKGKDKVLQRIVAARKKKKITQVEMARRLGVDVRTYRKKEGGNLKLEELRRICGILEITVLLVNDENILK